MSAIVAAMVARSRRISLMRQVSLVVDNATSLWRIQRSADYHEQRLAAAGRAIVDASNRACRAMVVEGAPRTWARWWCDGDSLVAAAWGKTYRVGMPPHAGLRPTWDAANRLWVWSTAAHDPRPCAWPRPFARGADR